MDGLGVVALGVLVLILTPITVFDLRSLRIPNAWNLILGASGLAYAIAREPSLSGAGWALGQALATAAILALTLWAAARVSPGARMGGGDVKFLIAATLWVGLEGAVAVLILASLMMVALAGARRLTAPTGWTEERAFAPMLAAGLLIVAAVFELGR